MLFNRSSSSKTVSTVYKPQWLQQEATNAFIQFPGQHCQRKRETKREKYTDPWGDLFQFSKCCDQSERENSIERSNNLSRKMKIMLRYIKWEKNRKKLNANPI